MKWDGRKMYKIIRLSKANIKRHTKEAVLLGILIFLCAMLLASSVSALLGIGEITPKMIEESGCYKNFIEVNQKIYSDRLLAFLEEDSRVVEHSHTRYASGEISIKNYKGSGNDWIFDASFVSENGERELEKFEIQTTLSDEQIKNLEHPIYFGKSEKERLAIKEGDEITLLIDNKEYTFTVAGFYESGVWMFSAKVVVSDEDLRMLEDYMNRYEVIGFNTTEEADADEVIKEFKEFVKDVSVNDASQAIVAYSYKDVVDNNEINMSSISKLAIIMAGIIIIAVIVMIRFRIVTDISEQMVSIGVLEAIGYKSIDIALSYIFEYVLIALIGCIFAFIPSIYMTGFLLKNAASIVHYCGQVDVLYSSIIFTMVGVILFVGMIAMSKALSVHKYPPVMALRKGIATHHFHKTFLPLEKTKRNVHIRLAFNDFLQNIKEKVGFVVCITVASSMFLTSFLIGSFFSNGENVLKSVCGHELADVKLEAVGGTDPESFAEELRGLPEVEKVLLSSTSVSAEVNNGNILVLIDIYEDFSETKTTVVTKGRLPKHDNEIAVTTQGGINNLKMGQTVTVEYNKVKRDYIVCGVVNSAINSNTIYMTEEGFKNLNPLYSPNAYKIFLREDVDQEAFVEKLTAMYGEKITYTKNGEVTGDALEERIRSAAEIKMAKAMSESGVSYMEYAIRVGDKLITGSTHNMKITSLEYEHDFYKNMMDQIKQIFVLITATLMAVSAIVVMIILSILMSSAIKKQYKELGIMKGMGYTSRELKFQMAFKMIPTTVIGVVVGSVISIGLISLIELILFKITVSIVSVIIVDFGLLLFCFVCAYVNAKKIGKISVCELMTE